MNFLFNIDTSILMFIREHLTNAFLDALMPIVTLLAEGGIVPIILSLALILNKKTRKIGLKSALALAVGFIIVNLIIKPLVGRIRPYDALYGIELLVSAKHDFSFPSGHTLAAFELAGVIALNCGKKYAYCAVIIACLVAFSRLYLFMHYPTDVIAGALLGLCFAYLSDFAVDTAYDRKMHA